MELWSAHDYCHNNTKTLTDCLLWYWLEAHFVEADFLGSSDTTNVPGRTV